MVRCVLYVVLRDCLLFVLVCVFCLICLLLSVRVCGAGGLFVGGLVVFLGIVGFLVVVCMGLVAGFVYCEFGVWLQVFVVLRLCRLVGFVGIRLRLTWYVVYCGLIVLFSYRLFICVLFGVVVLRLPC